MSESVCSAPLEGCFSYDCEPLPSSGCHDTWRKARLCWTVADNVGEAVSHYLVWTCCPEDTIRTLSVVDSKVDNLNESVEADVEALERTDSGAAHGSKTDHLNVSDSGPPAKITRQDQCSAESGSAAASETDAAQLTVPDTTIDDNARVSDDKSSCANTRERKTANLNTACSGPPINVGQVDHSCTSTTAWRCLGLTPVTSFSIESKNFPDCRGNFHVQPILSSGAVLPHINVIIK